MIKKTRNIQAQQLICNTIQTALFKQTRCLWLNSTEYAIDVEKTTQLLLTFGISKHVQLLAVCPGLKTFVFPCMRFSGIAGNSNLKSSNDKNMQFFSCAFFIVCLGCLKCVQLIDVCSFEAFLQESKVLFDLVQSFISVKKSILF